MNKERKKLQNRLYYCKKLLKKFTKEYSDLGGYGRLNYHLIIEGLMREISELKKLNENKTRSFSGEK